jgi:hypothetical protein
MFHRHVLPHGSYLVNLAQYDKAKAKQAYDSFLDDLHRCEALGIKLYNFQFVPLLIHSPSTLSLISSQSNIPPAQEAPTKPPSPKPSPV